MSQQWEYGTLYAQNNGPNVLCYFGRSGRIVRAEVEWADTIAHLGIAGWELVGVTVYDGGPPALYFKRPIEAGRAIDDAFEPVQGKASG